ncbi:MAG: hypothetical protein IID45_02040, partial [Planctomycetes bacterium]|nr:hypothetical protein [Planctomycetota bacterium]
MFARLRFSRQSFAALSAVLYGVVWTACLIDWKWLGRLPQYLDLESLDAGVNDVYAIVFFASLPIGLAVLGWMFWPVRRSQPLILAVASLFYIPWWQAAVFLTQWYEWAQARIWTTRVGIGGLFLIGLVWLVWELEKVFQKYESRRRQTRRAADETARNDDRPITPTFIWNPLDPAAWYYFGRKKRLIKSVLA